MADRKGGVPLMLADKLIKELAKNQMWFRIDKDEDGNSVEAPAVKGGAVIHHGYWKRPFEEERPELDVTLFDLLTKEVPRQSLIFDNSEALKCQFFDFGNIDWGPENPEALAEAEASKEGFELGLLQLPYPLCFFQWMEPTLPYPSAKQSTWAQQFGSTLSKGAEMGMLIFQPNWYGYHPVNIVTVGIRTGSIDYTGSFSLPVVGFVVRDEAIRIFGKDKMDYIEGLDSGDAAMSDTYENFAQNAMRFSMIMLGRLNADGMVKETVYPPEKVNRKRRAHGQPEKVKYTTVRVAPYHLPLGRSGPRENDFAPVRYHLRRGHVRRFKNGNTTWVRHCMVGDPTGGAVEHDYVVV